MCRSCQVSLRVREKWKSHLASRGDRSLLMLTRSEPSVSVHFMMKDGCHVANQIAWRWRRFGVCVQIGSAFAETLERVKWKALQISSVHQIFFKKIMYLFLALPFVHGADYECIREVLWGFEILSEQKLNFIFFPICLYSARAKKGVWAFGCSELGESMLHGQAKWGINT